ncbi:hypothetical protein [Brevibacillus laterosporus]|uniref:hypothetical protein n=1 Tax=Brevibacillus laterosporus TaxID=1465 RepID=UPI0015E1EDAA|nr:hypothetical protein [Brevibacillus laterosporus]
MIAIYADSSIINTSSMVIYYGNDQLIDYSPKIACFIGVKLSSNVQFFLARFKN